MTGLYLFGVSYLQTATFVFFTKHCPREFSFELKITDVENLMSAVLNLHSALPFNSNFCSSLPISKFSRFPHHHPMQSEFLKGKHCLLWMPKTLNFLSTLRLWHTAMRASVLGCVKPGRPISPVGGFFWSLSIPQAWEHTARTKISLPSNADSFALSPSEHCRPVQPLLPLLLLLHVKRLPLHKVAL